jgi:cell pole-organizing protein PopZ
MPDAAGADGRDPSMAEILASIQRILSENEPDDRAPKPVAEPARLTPLVPEPPAPVVAEAEPQPEPVAEPVIAEAPMPEPVPEPVMDADSDEVLVLERSMMVNDGMAVAEPAYKSSLLEAATSRDTAPVPLPEVSHPLTPHPFPLNEEEPVAEIAAPAPMEPPASPMSETIVAPPSPPPPMIAPRSAAPPMADEGLVAPDTAAIAKSAISNLVRTLAAERVVPVQRGGLTIEDLVREELRPLLKAWLDRHLPPLVEKLVQVEIERVVNRATS